jgi:hypothetical protein
MAIKKAGDLASLSFVEEAITALEMKSLINLEV